MTTDGHRHAASLDDSLDFVNTLELSDSGPIEHLPSLDAALAWLADRGLLHPDAASAERRAAGIGRGAAGRLAGIHRVRDALREVADAVAVERPADPEAVEIVNRTLRSREVIELAPAQDGISVRERDAIDALGDALARLVEPLAETVVSGRADRLRVCENETCRWVFFDRSRGGHRRWCDMRTCGNRVKARRHRERVRVARSETPPDAPTA
jgi:predicted RNA-binding Zn ribbon-like protein